MLTSFGSLKRYSHRKIIENDPLYATATTNKGDVVAARETIDLQPVAVCIDRQDKMYSYTKYRILNSIKYIWLH